MSKPYEDLSVRIGRPALPPVACVCESLPGEGVEAVGFARVGEGHPQAGHERGVQYDGGHLVASRQVHGGHGADALPVQDDVLRGHAVPGEGEEGGEMG